MGLFTGAFFAGAGVAQAFLPLWLADRGVTAEQIGAILGFSAVIRLAAVPGWGAVADHLPRRRPVLAAAALATGLLAAAYPLGHSVFGLAVLITLQGTASSGLTPLTDAVTLALSIEGRLQYGRVRAWGSASYMLATAAAGPVLSWTGSILVPWLMAASYGTAAALTALLPEPARAIHVAEPGGTTLFRLPCLPQRRPCIRTDPGVARRLLRVRADPVARRWVERHGDRAADRRGHRHGDRAVRLGRRVGRKARARRG